MANELDTNQSFGNFGIENTMEMGMGDSTLLNDLMTPETSTSNPDELTDIKDEKKDDKTSPSKTDDKKDEKKEVPDTNILKSFLDTTEDDDEKKDDKLDDKKSDDKDDDIPDDISKFTALSNDLFKLGVFNKEEDETDIKIDTPEQFLERFQIEKKKGSIEIVNNFIGQFGEDYQNAFDAIFVKGVNPKDYFGTYNNITDFASLDLKDENNQVAIVKKALTDQGFEPEDITTEVERIKNYGDLESVATKHHKVLVKKEAAKLQQMEQQAQDQLQQKAAIKNQYITNVNGVLQEKLKTKEFDGIPINPKLVNELQDFLLIDKYKTPTGETLTEFDKTILELKRPENHAQKVKIALLLKILEKDPTLSTIQKTGISKKSDALFSEVARQTSKTGVKSSAQKSTTSWFQ